MDEELFDLCREVSDKTGWHSKDLRLLGRGVKDVVEMFPLYTSDFILEKLPKYIAKPTTAYLTVMVGHSSGGYIAGFYQRVPRHWFHSQSADTPLKSLLKLTIALHEAKELK